MFVFILRILILSSKKVLTIYLINLEESAIESTRKLRSLLWVKSLNYSPPPSLFSYFVMLYLLIIQTVIVQTTAPSSEAGIMSTWGLWSRAIYDHGGCYIPQTKQLHSSSCPRTAKLGGRTEHSPLYFVEHAGRMPDTLCRSQFHSIHWFLRLPAGMQNLEGWQMEGWWILEED